MYVNINVGVFTLTLMYRNIAAKSDVLFVSCSPPPSVRSSCDSDSGADMLSSSPTQHESMLQDSEEDFHVVGRRHKVNKHASESGNVNSAGQRSAVGCRHKVMSQPSSSAGAKTLSSTGSDRKEQMNRDRCWFEFNCPHGTQCLRMHKKEELEYFEKRKSQYARDKGPHYNGSNGYRKTQKCIHGSKCFNWLPRRPCGPECDYYHDESVDAWCTKCLVYGHLCGSTPSCQHLVEVTAPNQRHSYGKCH